MNTTDSDLYEGTPNAMGAGSSMTGEDCQAALASIEAKQPSILERLLDEHQRNDPHHADMCPTCKAAQAAIDAQSNLRMALGGLHRVCQLALAGKDGGQYAYFESRAGHFVSATQAMEAAEVALAAPGQVDPDLLDIVRTLVCSVDEWRNRNDNYPSPIADGSPLMAAARAACVAYGYTPGGLAQGGAQ